MVRVYLSHQPNHPHGPTSDSPSCEDALFRAGSAKKWAQIVQRGSIILMPSLVLDPSSARLPKFDTPVDDFGMYGLLSIIWLYILEADYRLLSGSTHGLK